MSVIVYGPQGCGKTLHAEELRRHFSMERVIEEWAPGDPLPEDCLALTNVPDVPGAVPFGEILAQLERP